VIVPVKGSEFSGVSSVVVGTGSGVDKTPVGGVGSLPPPQAVIKLMVNKEIKLVESAFERHLISISNFPFVLPLDQLKDIPIQ
jgi:hypothetical protein